MCKGRAVGFDGSGMAELEGAEDCVEAVTAHVAEGTGPEIQPPAPYQRQIGRMIWSILCRSEPQVPVESFGDGRRLFGPVDTLGPDWAV